MCCYVFCDRKLGFIYIHDAHILQVDLDGMICTNDEVSESWKFWSHEGVLWLCFTYLFSDVNSGFGIVMVSLFYSMLQTFPDKFCVDIETTRVSNGARPELFQHAIWWGSLYVSLLYYNTLKHVDVLYVRSVRNERINLVLWVCLGFWLHATCDGSGCTVTEIPTGKSLHGSLHKFVEWWNRWNPMSSFHENRWNPMGYSKIPWKS